MNQMEFRLVRSYSLQFERKPICDVTSGNTKAFSTSISTLFISLFDCTYLTHPTPGTEPGGRMRCAISSMISLPATLDTRQR